tara:strand:+ start:546 stop:1313 length:768 start_codon:yes stop_codon:yes gene_type:complete
MIKLFRNIRKNLLKEGKTSKYVKYAIGEILLVVIGILIALQINNWNETNVERSLEKEYIISLIEDIKKDTKNFNNAIELNKLRISSLDSFASLCFDYKKENDYKVLLMYQSSLRHPDFVSQTDRTLTQLRNSGGMRLITKKITADAIIQYEDYFKKLANQQVWYESMLKDLIDAGIPVFNFKYLPKSNLERVRLNIDELKEKVKIEATADRSIIGLGNIANTYSSVTLYYLTLLKEGNQQSMDLINVLQTDYDLK